MVDKLPLRRGGSAFHAVLIAAAPVPVFGAAFAVLAVPEWRDFREALYEENSPLELLTFAGFLAAAFWSFLIARRAFALQRDLLTASFCLAFGAGCLLVAGEEIAWGQWLLDFETPQAWKSINTQQEMTLHNVSGLQGKTEAFRLAFGLGGLAGVALKKVPPFPVVAPPLALAPWFCLIAVFAAGELLTDLLTLSPEHLHKALRAKFFSEYQELVISALSLLYLWSVSRRIPRTDASFGVPARPRRWRV